MTATETSQTTAVDQQYLQGLNDHKSTFQKYFAVSNPDSLLSNELVSLSAVLSKPSEIVSAIIHFPATVASTFRPIFSSLFGHAAAAGDTNTEDYNVVQWGWTNDEENLINSDPSFDPLVNAQVLQDSGESQAILDKYGVCFGVKDDGSGNTIPDPAATMGELISGGGDENNRMVYLDDNGNIDPTQGLCSPANLSYNNNEFGTKMIFRWRLNQSYMNAMNELTDMQSLAGGASQ